MTRKETESIVYRGDAYVKLPKTAAYHAHRTSRRPAAFWLDWAPMLLLGLIAAFAGVYQIGTSLDAGSTSPAIVETRQAAPPTVLVETKPVAPPAASRPIQSAAPAAERDLRS